MSARLLLSAALLVAPVSQAWAVFWDAEATQTFGSDDFRSSAAQLTIGGDSGLSLTPSFDLSSSSGQSVARVYRARLAWAPERWSLAAEGALTPRYGEYASHALGAEIGYIFGSLKRRRGPRLSLGAGLLYTRHGERFDRPNASPLFQDTDQTDVFVPADCRLGNWELYAEHRRSYYDRAIPSRPRAALAAQARGANPVVFGLPAWSAEARVTRNFRDFSPFISANYTAFKVDQPPGRSYTAGARGAIGPAELTLSYELYDAGRGSLRKNYFSLSVRAGF